VGIKETGCEVADCTHLAEERIQWRTLLNTVMTHSGSLKCRGHLKQLNYYPRLNKDFALCRQLFKGCAGKWKWLTDIRSPRKTLTGDLTSGQNHIKNLHGYNTFLNGAAVLSVSAFQLNNMDVSF